MTTHDRRHTDDVIDALDVLTRALERARGEIDAALRRAAILRRQRAAGMGYARILSEAERPLIVESVTTVLASLSDAGSRFRRAQARAVYAEGLSMEMIGRLLGVSRQRVSSLVRRPERVG